MNVCHLCGEDKLLSLLYFGEHPIAHHFLTDPSEEEYVHPVDVCFCASCGLIQLNNPIPPNKLYTNYNWLSSWKWNPHVPRILDLIGQLFYDLDRESKVIEIGSNDGTFLESLRMKGYQNLLGVEPTQDGQNAARKKGIETVGTYFNRETANILTAERGKYDLFIARQMLEHVTDLRDFREAINIILRPGGYVLIEVPNFEFSLQTFDYSAIWEEHVNYFTLETLTRFLTDAGIRVIHTETANFCGEALMVFGKYEGDSATILVERHSKELQADAFAYRDRWPTFQGRFLKYLDEYRKNGGRVAIYGAGCRACSLINFAGLGSYLEFCLDDQPEKQGKYMPGSRLAILPGERLENSTVDFCLLAVNAESEEKVIANHRTYQEKGGRFASVHPPSKRLLTF